MALTLYSSWILSRSPDAPPDEMPEEYLDRGLQLALDQGAFAPWKDKLHFIVGAYRLQCVELPDILFMAMMSCVTDQLSPRVAYVFCRRLDLDPMLVRGWGLLLRAGVQEAKQRVRAYLAGT